MSKGGLERQQKQNEHVRDMEDLANLKSAIYTATESVFSKLAEQYELDDDVIRRFREAIKERLIGEEHYVSEDELQAMASQALNTTLEQLKLDKPGLARDFQKELRFVMDGHFKTK